HIVQGSNPRADLEVVDAIRGYLAVGGAQELGYLVDVPLHVRHRLAPLLKPPLIITSRFANSGRCMATSIATNAPSLCPTRFAGSPSSTVSRKAIVSSAIS